MRYNQNVNEKSENQSPISSQLNELVRMTMDFAFQKFMTGEYFSLVQLTRHIKTGGQIARARYRLETMQESVEQARAFIANHGNDITMYALAYLAEPEASGSAMVGWLEEENADSAWLMKMRYKIEDRQGQTVLMKARGIELIEKAGFKWLPR